MNCTSFQGYDKIQSLLVFAVVIEAEVDHEFQNQNYDHHSTKENGSVQEKLVPLCNALCHLLVSSTAYIRTAMYDSPGASTKILLQKSMQLFQRALVDSGFVFVNSIWKSFLQVAHNEKDYSMEEKSQETYKFALLYAKSIYDMVPSTLQNYDRGFFDQEIKNLVGDVDFNELQRWLKDEVFVVKRETSLNDSSQYTEPNSTDLESERLSTSSFDNHLVDKEHNQIVIFNGMKNSQALKTESNLNQLEYQQMDADDVKDERKLVVFDPYGTKATILQKEEEDNRQLILSMNKKDSTMSNNMNGTEQCSKSLVRPENASKDLKIPWNTTKAGQWGATSDAQQHQYEEIGADDIHRRDNQMVLLNATEKLIVHDDLNDHSEVNSKSSVNDKYDKDENQILVPYGAQLSIAKGHGSQKQVQGDLFESTNIDVNTSLNENNQIVAYNKRTHQGNNQIVNSDGQNIGDERNLITMKDDVANSDIIFGSNGIIGTQRTLLAEALVVKGKIELNDKKDVNRIDDSYAKKCSDVNDMDQQIQLSLKHDTFQIDVETPKPDLLTLHPSTSTALNGSDTERHSVPSDKNHSSIASSSVISIESNAMEPKPNPLALPPPTSSNFKTSGTERDTSPSDRNRSSRASSLAESDVLAPLQNEHRHFNTSGNHYSYEERIQAKQKGMAAAPIRSLSYRSESSGSILANDEAAKIERRIAAKTAGHYESDRSVTKFATASFSSNVSESSRSSSISGSKSKGRKFLAALKSDVPNSHSSHEDDSIETKFHNVTRSNHSGSEGDTKDDDLSLASRDASLASKDPSNRLSGQFRRMSQHSSNSSFYSQDTAILEQKINSIWQRNKTSSKEVPESESMLNERENTNAKTDRSAAHSAQAKGTTPVENHQDAQVQSNGIGHIFQLPSTRNRQERRETSSSYTFDNDERQDTTALLHERENNFQPPGEDSGIAVATAVEKECLDNADDAIIFDPKSRARMMNKKLYIWTACALVSAITVSTVLGLVFTKQNEPIITSTVEPTAPPTTSYYWTIKQHVQASFGENKPYEDFNSPYGKALHWLAASDLYIFSVTEKFNDSQPKSGRNNLSNNTEARFVHDVSTRYFLALFYYHMSGDQWVNCSASNLAPTTGSCSFFNRDSDLINGKKNWLSSTSVCEWAGITCGEDDMSIERIELSK